MINTFCEKMVRVSEAKFLTIQTFLHYNSTLELDIRTRAVCCAFLAISKHLYENLLLQIIIFYIVRVPTVSTEFSLS